MMARSLIYLNELFRDPFVFLIDLHDIKAGRQVAYINGLKYLAAGII